MHDATPLIATIVGGLVLAFVFGAIAHRLRLPVLAGYLLAGVVAGPFTPGYVADAGIAQELADLGVILLMFGVGLHFSLKDLLAVKSISIPGAAGQMGVATGMGMVLGWALGWPLAQGFVFGLALSVASTVVLLRAMEERRLLDSDRGRIAVGWLIVEDLAMVLALVLLPAIGGFLGTGQGGPVPSMSELLTTVGLTIGKVVLFVAVMLVVGKRVIPWTLQAVSASGSRELFRLAVLAIALGVAFGAAHLFDVSFELGAFFAGMMMGESKLSQRAAEETLPLRDAFAVLFFVSIGMLFNPGIVVQHPWIVLAACLIIVVGKSLAAYAIVRAFGRPPKTALTIATSLAQIGEFSFILAGLGVSVGLLSEQARDVLLAAAIVSILINPLLFIALDRWVAKHDADAPDEHPIVKGHTVLVGFGRVGRRVFAELSALGAPILVIETDEDAVRELREGGEADVVIGNAAAGPVLAEANLAAARALIVAVPDPFEGGQVVRAARALRPDLPIIARAHSSDCMGHLSRLGASEVVYGEEELARRMVEVASPAPVATSHH
ncbi:YbaL family putative K(+) efflux transporter [Luteibacter sahnii]|uniref:YbaL family putative K(+) efflux transporter n=1 Tax=Luteibacter sahnii TaxID=3021977 RepID=UPI002A6B83FF|nr:YbaL family putative K(+) efflux transporter [Luteibacter sp. PPL193]MDY1546882.1 YbaL family putative K(+) efflux transporter [Luteibacter sp. PPL193]